MPPPIFSYIQARQALQARPTLPTTLPLSFDLGLTQTQTPLDVAGIHFPDHQILAWEDCQMIAEVENACFSLEDNTPAKVQIFSAETNRLYSLMPTEGAPTMLISGIPMHRFKGVDPHRDTQLKIKALTPIVGHVLDTATGLGYTAIAAAQRATHVITIEVAEASLEIARLNPWSQALFDNPKITQRLGDSADLVPEFPDASFDRILHDPPAFSLAGHLYSGDFYSELWRVLRPKGRLFHYIGDPESKSGRNITRSVMRRLQESGFTRVERHPQAFGVVAFK